MKAVFGFAIFTGMITWLTGWVGLLALALTVIVAFWVAAAIRRGERDGMF